LSMDRALGSARSISLMVAGLSAEAAEGGGLEEEAIPPGIWILLKSNSGSPAPAAAAAGAGGAALAPKM